MADRRRSGAIVSFLLAATTCVQSDALGKSAAAAQVASTGWTTTINEVAAGNVGGQSIKRVIPSADKADVTLNFSNASISEVVRAVLGDALGLNYILAPKIEGSITVRTSSPITRKAAFSMLEQVLLLHDLTIVKAGEVYQVLPLKDASHSPTRPSVYPDERLRDQGYGIEVVPLRFISAAQMEKLLTSVAPEHSVLYADQTRNYLLLGGTSDEIKHMLEIVSTLDVDFMKGSSFALVPLEHSDANTVADDLTRIFNINKDNPPGPIRVIPVTHLNSVLLVGSEMEYVNHAREWIKTLDKGDETSQRLYVYYLQNGRVNDVAAVLGKLFGGASAAHSESKGEVAPSYTPMELASAQPLANNVPAVGVAGPPPGAPGEVSIAPPATTSPTAPPEVAEANATVVEFKGKDKVRLVAEPAINALVIYASPPDYDTILSALRKIDIAPLQVLIEATIAEVTLSGDFQYGLEWFFGEIDNSVGQSVSNNTSGGADIVNTAVAFASGFSYLGATKDFHVVLNAISHQTDVNIISSPQLMVLNNQTARIQVGDQVPVLSQQSVSTITAGAPVVNSVQYVDSGVILEVKPHVNNNGEVLLDITQQVSQPVTTVTSNIDSPTIQQRLITSSVAVQSGQTVALGGLIGDRASKTGEGIPALRRIPILGSLFGVKGRDSTRTELLVLITPKVVRDWQDAQEVSYELGNRMRSLAPLSPKIQ